MPCRRIAAMPHRGHVECTVYHARGAIVRPSRQVRVRDVGGEPTSCDSVQNLPDPEVDVLSTADVGGKGAR